MQPQVKARINKLVDAEILRAGRELVRIAVNTVGVLTPAQRERLRGMKGGQIPGRVTLEDMVGLFDWLEDISPTWKTAVTEKMVEKIDTYPVFKNVISAMEKGG